MAKNITGITGTALSAHLFCTRETLSDYVAKGLVLKLANGKYDPDDARERVLKHLRDRAAGRQGHAKGGLDLSNERAKLAAGQTDRVAFNLAKERGEYVPIQSVTDIVARVFAVIREKILTREGKLADALTMQKRAVVAAALHQDAIEVLNELAAPSSYDLRGGGAVGSG